MNVSVIIPAYNEEARIAGALEKIWHYFSDRQTEFEVIVVDDGSIDRTGDLVRDFAERHKEVKLLENGRNRGKGYSVRRGILEALGDRVLFTDADLSTPIADVERLFPFLERGFDVIIGSRGVADPDVEVCQTAFRKELGRVFNRLVQWLVLPGFQDTQCGFKCFSRDAAKEIFANQQIDRFGFDPEVLYIAKKFGYSIKEVPVSWSHSPFSKVSLLWDSIDMFKDLVRIRWLHGGPGEAVIPGLPDRGLQAEEGDK